MEILKIPLSLGLLSKSTVQRSADQKSSDGELEPFKEKEIASENTKNSKSRKELKSTEPNAQLQKPDLSSVETKTLASASGIEADQSVDVAGLVGEPNDSATAALPSTDEAKVEIPVETVDQFTAYEALYATTTIVPNPASVELSHHAVDEETSADRFVDTASDVAVPTKTETKTSPLAVLPGSNGISLLPPNHGNSVDAVKNPSLPPLSAVDQNWDVDYAVAAGEPASVDAWSTKPNTAVSLHGAVDAIAPSADTLLSISSSLDAIDPKFWEEFAQSQAVDAYVAASPSGDEDGLAFDAVSAPAASSDTKSNGIKAHVASVLGATDAIDPKFWSEFAVSQAIDAAHLKPNVPNSAVDANHDQEVAMLVGNPNEAFDATAVDAIPSAGSTAQADVHPAPKAAKPALAADVLVNGNQSNQGSLAVDAHGPAVDLDAPAPNSAVDANNDADSFLEAFDSSVDPSSGSVSNQPAPSVGLIADPAPKGTIGAADSIAPSPDRIAAAKKLASSILSQVADRLEAIAAAKPRRGVTVHLKPFDLGQITMTVKTSGKSIEADFQVSNDAVRQAIEQTQKHLSANLEARGFSLSTLTIGASNSTNAHSNPSDAQSRMAQQHEHGPSGSSAQMASNRGEGISKTGAARAMSSTVDGVDYRI